MRYIILLSLAFVVVTVSAVSAIAHNGVKHNSVEEAVRHLGEEGNTPGFPTIKGGDFSLTDHTGGARTSKDPNGQYQLVFFGYANCKAICSVALPRMAAAVTALEDKGVKVTPVLITVDPKNDTVKGLAKAVPKIHPRLVGLTGTSEALGHAYKAFQIEKKLAFVDPDHGPVYSHGSFIYLLDPHGNFKTLLPPIVSSDRISEVTQSYIEADLATQRTKKTKK